MNYLSTEALFIILAILILMSGFFSGSETALISLNRHKLKYLVKSGHKGAIIANWLLERPDRLIGLILIFNNFVNILASAIATLLGLRLFGEPGIAIATGLLTFIILIFSEVTPKTYAAINPEKVAFPAAFILKPLLKLIYPIVFFINFISNNLLNLLNLTPENSDSRMSKDELRSIVNETHTLIPSEHQKMLLSILDLEAVTVEDIMIPRHEIYAINIQDEEQQLTEQIVSSLHTRIPVYEEEKDKLIGVIHLKNALPLIVKGEVNRQQFREIMREPYFIPEGTSLHQQLLNFQKNERRVGFVVNEYGEFQGLVTLEDILEEIVGEFTTDPSGLLTDDIYPQEDGSYLLDGSINLRDLNKAMDWDLPTDNAKTINGLLLEYLESIPELGTSVLINNYPIEIIKIQNNSIKKVKINPRLTDNEKASL